jgi:two-component system cell cycle sensor histidine kinase/response regulator CckA
MLQTCDTRSVLPHRAARVLLLATGPPLSAEEQREVTVEANAPQNAQRTILVVDDDEALLGFVTRLLVNSNYNVLSASSGAGAIQQSRDYQAEIHLLLTDFEMAHMTGIEIATALCIDRPDMKVLLMSGFNGGMLVLNEGWHFLAKPFIASQLRTLIRGLIPATAG